MLFLQALMFYLPHIIYEMAEGKKVNIISKNIQIRQMSRGMWTFVLKISQSKKSNLNISIIRIKVMIVVH